MQQGIICSLTNTIADFEGSCASYTEDTKLKEKEIVLAVTRDLVGKEASQGIRFTNYLLDFVFIMVFSFVIGIVLAIISPSVLDTLEEDNPIINYIFGFIIGMIYYSFFEMTTGRTLGKLITGTKVVDEDGKTPDPGTFVTQSLPVYPL